MRLMQQGITIGKLVIEMPRQVNQTLQPDASYVITGGLGGLGLLLCEWLSSHGARHIALLARRQASPEMKERLSACEADITYHQVELTDSEALKHAIITIQHTHPIRGIFHLAGVLDDGVISEQTLQRLEKVWQPKAVVAHQLHELTVELKLNDHLDYFVLFSSIASILGSPGQSNYAAANSFLDALAYYRKALQLPALSINWGPWAQAGMAASLVQIHKTRGLTPLSPELGFKWFELALIQSNPVMMFAQIDWTRVGQQARITSWLRLLIHKQQKGQLTQLLQNAPAQKREALLQAQLESLIKEITHTSDKEHIDIKRHFFEMGFDSLMVIELKNKLQEMVGDKIYLKNDVFFKHSNIEALTNYLLNQLVGDKEIELPPFPKNLNQDIVLKNGENAVLLLYGLSGTPLEVMYLARHLYKEGYSVEIPYIEGYIYSTDRMSRRKQEDWLISISNYFQNMKQQYKSVAVGGLSAGAILSLKLAQLFPSEVNSLILLSSSFFKDGWTMPWYSFLFPIIAHSPLKYFLNYKEKAPYGIKNPETQQLIQDDMKEMQYSITGGSKISFYRINEVNRLVNNVKSELAKVTCPILLIHAIEDETASIRNAIYINNHVKSESKKMVILTNSYHIITADNEKDTVVNETIHFLNANKN